MAVNIETYLSNILSAVYGEEVRGSIHDALEIMSKYVGFTILGHYDSYAKLIEAHPTGNPGDYYTAGVDLYTWNNNQWESCGRLTGRGIVSITKTNTSGLVDTYTVTYDDETTSTFQVTNGNGVAKIEKTGSDSLVDTYTITYDNGSNTTFSVTNGRGITSITKKSAAGLIDTYEILFNDSTKQQYTVTNGNGIDSIDLKDTAGLVDTYEISYTNGNKKEYEVTNGNGISKVEKTGSDGLTDHYKITFTNGTEQNYDVSNGKGITNIEKTNTSGLVDTYTITFNDSSTLTFDVTNGAKGNTGNAATIAVGTVEATASGGIPEITNSGDEHNVVFNFKLPRGEQGEQGLQGYSPQAKVEQTGDEITITITDQTGTTTTSFVPGGTYVLPQATATALGGIKANTATGDMTEDVGIDSNGFLKVKPQTPYVLPKASSELGGVKANAASQEMTEEIGIDDNGYLKHKPATPYTLPVASPNTLGGVKPVSASLDMTQDVGVTSGGALKTKPYSLPQATAGALGGVKVNQATADQTENVGIDSSGVLKVKPQVSEIDDTQPSASKSYSSQKTESVVTEIKCKIYTVNYTIPSFTENPSGSDNEKYYADVPCTGMTEDQAVTNTTPAPSTDGEIQGLLTYAVSQNGSVRCYFSEAPDASAYVIESFIAFKAETVSVQAQSEDEVQAIMAKVAANKAALDEKIAAANEALAEQKKKEQIMEAANEAQKEARLSSMETGIAMNKMSIEETSGKTNAISTMSIKPLVMAMDINEIPVEVGEFTDNIETFEVGREYKEKEPFVYNGIAGVTQKVIPAGNTWEPYWNEDGSNNGKGTESVFIPRPKKETDGSYNFVYGMKIVTDMIVNYNGKKYKAFQPANVCTWYPDNEAAHLFEEIREG